MRSIKNDKWVVKTAVSEEVYTNREEFLDYFYKAALDAAGRRTMSTVLLGQRRMGKTEIFKRVVNRLFSEQDPADPDAVLPVYFSFPDGLTGRKDFAGKYLDNFLRYYIAFYTRNPRMARKDISGKDLGAAAREARPSMPFPESVDWLLSMREAVETDDIYMPHQMALEAPRRVSDDDDSTIVVFLDEFQNTRLAQNKFDIVGFMQEAGRLRGYPPSVEIGRGLGERGGCVRVHWDRNLQPTPFHRSPAPHSSRFTFSRFNVFPF